MTVIENIQLSAVVEGLRQRLKSLVQALIDQEVIYSLLDGNAPQTTSPVLEFRLFGVKVQAKKASILRVLDETVDYDPITKVIEPQSRALENLESWKRALRTVDVIWSTCFCLWKNVEQDANSLLVSCFIYFMELLDGSWAKFLKYNLAWVFAHYNMAEVPEPIDSCHKPGYLLSGGMGRFLGSKLSSHMGHPRKRDLTALNTFLQGTKRGFNELGLNDVFSNALKHSERLSRVNVTPPRMLDFIRSHVPKIIREPVRVKDIKLCDTLSHSACLEEKRQWGGPHGHLVHTLENGYRTERIREKGKKTFDIVFPETICLAFDLLVCMKWSPIGGLLQIHVKILESEIMSLAREQTIKLMKEGPLDVSVKFILEPLKIRTITKSSLYVNSLYPNLQKDLWRQLADSFQCQLVGRPVDETIIRELVARTDQVFNRQWSDRPGDSEESSSEKVEIIWNSGDYSAATDQIHLDATMAALEGSTNDFHAYYIMKNALGGGVVSYKNCVPDWDEVKEDFDWPEDFVQTNGQLMGCSYSFPFLCLINLCVYWDCLESYFKRSFRFEDLPVLVNGDDILFGGPKEFLDIWSQEIKEVGFEKSIGKNYQSTKFLLINSCFFYNFPRGPTFIPWVNMGFVYGERSESELECTDKTDNGRLWNLLGSLRDANWEFLPKDVCERYLSCLLFHRRDIGRSHWPLEQLGIPINLIGDRRQYRERLFYIKAHSELSKVPMCPLRELSPLNNRVRLDNLDTPLPHLKDVWKNVRTGRGIRDFDWRRWLLKREMRRNVTSRIARTFF